MFQIVNMKILKKVIIATLVLFIAIQFIRPDKNISTDAEYVVVFENETQISKPMAEIFKNTCYDCHSSNTKYPWYSAIAPMSFVIDHHIEEGKEHLDFSQWLVTQLIKHTN